MPAAKKKTTKKTAPKKAVPKAVAKPAKPIGKITHFFDKISVAVVKLDAPLKIGDKIRIEGRGKSFTQAVDSMQVEHEQLTAARKGQEVGMKVKEAVKDGDLVYKA